MFYFSDVIDANKAYELGLVNYLKNSVDLTDFVNVIKDKFRELPPIAIRYMKKNLNNALLGNLDVSLNEEAIHMMICSETEDHKNAVKAFVKKEKPKFIGK